VSRLEADVQAGSQSDPSKLSLEELCELLAARNGEEVVERIFRGVVPGHDGNGWRELLA
jgi:hypothetical protein